MKHSFITISIKTKSTNDRSYAKVIVSNHKTNNKNNKPLIGGLSVE